MGSYIPLIIFCLFINGITAPPPNRQAAEAPKQDAQEDVNSKPVSLYIFIYRLTE